MAVNPASILDCVKKWNGFEPEYEVFDTELLMNINTVIGSLLQLGVLSDTELVVGDNTVTWASISDRPNVLNLVKTYVAMSVKMMFDPPQTSFGIDAIRKQLDQLEFRINVAAEEENPPTDPFATEDVSMYGTAKTYIAPKVIILEYSETVSPDASAANVFRLTLTGDCLIGSPVNGVTGEHITLELTSAGFNVTWGTGWNFGEPGIPLLSPAKTDVISAYYNGDKAEWFAGVTAGF
jgi:hypothetical protein